MRRYSAVPAPALWIGGSSLSLLGDQIYSTASAWTASQQGGASGATVVALSVTIPRLVLMVLGGPIADRIGPRVVLIGSDAVRTALMVGGAVWALSGASIGLLITVGIVLGSFSGLAAGSNGSMLPRLVSDTRLAAANSASMLAGRMATVSGSVLAGLLIAGPGLATIMFVNALSFTVSLACVSAIGGLGRLDASGSSDHRERSLWREALTGYGYVAGDAVLRWLILSGLLLELGFSWAFNAGIAPLAQDRGWGPGALSATLAAFAVSGLVATLVGTRWGDRASWLRVIAGELAIACGLLLMAGARADPWLWYAGCAVAGLGSGQVGPMLVTLVQRRTRPERMGVSMAAVSMASLGSVSVSVAIFGAIASLSSSQTAWWASGATVLLSPIVAATARRQLAGTNSR